MNALEKKAAKEDLTTAFSKRFVEGSPDNWVLGRNSKLSRGIGHVAYGPASAIAAAPGRLAANSLGGLLFGAKEMNPLSPMYGKRLKSVGGTKGLEEVSKAEFERIKQGLQKGKAYKGKISGHALPQFYKRKYVPGGITGFAKKHPLLTGGGALLAYYLAKNPQSRAMASEMVPRMNTDISPDTIKQWKEPDVVSPFQRRAWG